MALVAGKNTLSSGTGAWTIEIPTNASIAIDDPPTRNPIVPGIPVPDADFALFPTMKLVIDLRNDAPSVITVVGDESTHAANPPDSIGFTVNTEIDLINDTGHALTGVTLNLTDLTQALPYNLVPGVIEYGESVNANYTYFSRIQPVPGETMTLFSPDGKPTTATGVAPSKMVLTGNIAPGATVVSSSVIHETELNTTFSDFSLTALDSPTANFVIADISTGTFATSAGEPYTGPVAGLSNDIIMLTSDNINITAETPNVFIHSGSGNDALDVSAVNGNNVLDGGTGSNFLVGGAGNDTFYVDDRNPSADIWSTLKGFHSGDNATVWGLTPSDFSITPLDNQGAVGATGLTFSIAAAGHPNANLTMAGYTTADLTNGRLAMSFGRTPDLPGLPGSNFMLIHGA